MVDHVAANEGLQLQLIEYMPEFVGNPEWEIDIERIHDWLCEQADSVTTREMHSRRRYHIGDGVVEIVDPVGNETFCQNCHRIRVTHEGYVKGRLDRNDDLRSMGEMTKAEIRETITACRTTASTSSKTTRATG